MGAQRVGGGPTGASPKRAHRACGQIRRTCAWMRL